MTFARSSRRIGRRVLLAPALLAALVLVCTALVTGVARAEPATGAVCASTLTADDTARIATLTDLPPRDPGADVPLATLQDHVARLWAVTDILTARGDRRGLFAAGLAVTERDAVMPRQVAEQFADPAWARRVSTNLLDRFLAAMHADATGAPVPPQWQRYTALAQNCSISGERAAMAGYNAHITVDLAYATADARTEQRHAGDFFSIVDTIAAHGDSIVAVTRERYGVDLGPAFRFYFVGEGLDRVVGAGRASDAMLRAADVGYNVLTFGNGLALQDPSTHDAAVGAVDGLWRTGDAALEAAQIVGVLR